MENENTVVNFHDEIKKIKKLRNWPFLFHLAKLMTRS